MRVCNWETKTIDLVTVHHVIPCFLFVKLRLEDWTASKHGSRKGVQTSHLSRPLPSWLSLFSRFSTWGNVYIKIWCKTSPICPASHPFRTPTPFLSSLTSRTPYSPASFHLPVPVSSQALPNNNYLSTTCLLLSSESFTNVCQSLCQFSSSSGPLGGHLHQPPAWDPLQSLKKRLRNMVLHSYPL